MKNNLLFTFLLLGCFWPGVGFSQHVPPEPGEGKQFLWPLDAWVASDERYADGSTHSGTADLAAPHYTPVRPARSGVVTEVRWTNRGGWIVDISHPGNGYTYFTKYTHLIEKPLVAVGDKVVAVNNGGTLIGYVGRLGNADVSGPHVHFVISRQRDGDSASEVMSIPGIDKGDWVRSGKFVSGVYPGLTAMNTEASRTFAAIVRDSDGANIYASSSLQSRTGSIAEGTDLVVIDTHDGAYQVRLPDNTTGWVAHSATLPSRSNIFNLGREDNIIIRRTPSTDLPEIGVMPKNTLLTGFDIDDNGWYLVQWRCNAKNNRSGDAADNDKELGGCPNDVSGNKYGWVGPLVPLTDTFHARTRVDNMAVYANRQVDGADTRDPSTVLGNLKLGSRITAIGSKDGWYKLQFEDQTGWIRGWQTAGAQ